jgi:S1-C subfamily serine protease
MQKNPPFLLFVILITVIVIFAIGALIAFTQSRNADEDIEGTRTLSEVVRENEPIAPAAASFAPCIFPTLQPAEATAVDAGEQPGGATQAAPAATVALPPAQVLISDETFVGRQAENELITNDNPGYLGVVVQDVLTCGSQIMEFAPNGPAADSELQIGDVIVAVNGIALSSLTGETAGVYIEATPRDVAPVEGAQPFTPAMVLFNQVHQLVPGVTVTLTVQRSGESFDIRLPLGAFP